MDGVEYRTKSDNLPTFTDESVLIKLKCSNIHSSVSQRFSLYKLYSVFLFCCCSLAVYLSNITLCEYISSLIEWKTFPLSTLMLSLHDSWISISPVLLFCVKQFYNCLISQLYSLNCFSTVFCILLAITK